MRILISGQTYLPGANGQAVFTIHLAEGLAAAGDAVLMLAPLDRLASRDRVVNGVRLLERPSIALEWLHPELFISLLYDPGIGRLIDGFRPDVVHIQDHYPLSRNVLRQAERRGLPTVGTNHFLPENVLPYVPKLLRGRPAIAILWWTMLSAYNRLDVATTPTETAAQILRGQAIQSPVEAISCGVDTRRFCPQPGLDRQSVRLRYHLDPQKPLYIYVGRLDGEKRLDVLIHAFARLSRPDAHLAIGGRGAAGAALQALVRRLGLDKQVTFTGYIPHTDLPSVLAAADCFCMPSPEELQSIASLEAMASGLPVIAADARALPELVAHGVNGYLFHPGDFDDLAHWMCEMLDHPGDRARMARTSLERAQKHSLENTIRRYRAVYASLLPGKESSAPERVLQGS